MTALQALSAYWRNKVNPVVIAVTGSAGKTTTKDLIASIIKTKFKTLKTEGNFNNEIGLPLTLLNLKKSDKVAVLEMGMQGLGEIKILAKIAKPNIAIITNIGEAHLLHLKNKKNIASAKSEIFTFLKKCDFAIIPEDDQFFRYLKSKVPNNVKILTYGKKDFAKYEKLLKTLPLPGDHNKLNALAGIRVAEILGIEDKYISVGIKKFKHSSKRMEFIKKNGITIINDSYNANPSAVKAALSVLKEVKGKRKIAVLGDMLELGKKSKELHHEVGEYAKKLNIDIVITVGKESKAIKSDYHFDDLLLARKKLYQIAQSGDIVLIKGSRGMKLENMI